MNTMIEAGAKRIEDCIGSAAFHALALNGTLDPVKWSNAEMAEYQGMSLQEVAEAQARKHLRWVTLAVYRAMVGAMTDEDCGIIIHKAHNLTGEWKPLSDCVCAALLALVEDKSDE